MNKFFFLLLFIVGDCVQVIPNVWWSYKNWTVIGIQTDGYIINDGEWTVHAVPEKMLRKCEEKK